MHDNIVLNPKLWELAHKEADKIYDKPSAYKSGFIVKYYKDHGGTFRSKPAKSPTRSKSPNRSKSPTRSKTGLTRWFAEKWVNQRGEVGYKKKGDVYRPSIRVNKKTPKTWNELTKKQIATASKAKATGRRAKF